MPEALAEVGETAERHDAEHPGERPDEQSPGPARRHVPGSAVRRTGVRDIADLRTKRSRLGRQRLDGGSGGQEKEGQAEQGGLQARHKVCVRAGKNGPHVVGATQAYIIGAIWATSAQDRVISGEEAADAIERTRVDTRIRSPIGAPDSLPAVLGIQHTAREVDM